MSEAEIPLRRLLRQSLVTLTLFWFFLNILPLTPLIETGSSRGTWPLVLNLSFSQGRQFGTEVVFTYGPWGFLGTQYYAPPTYPLLLLSWIFLSLAMSIGVWNLTAPMKSSMGRALTYSLFLFLISLARFATTDVFFFLLAFVLLLVSETSPRFPFSRALLASGLALASLAKFSCLMAALPVLGITLIEDVRRRRVPVAPISFALAYIGFWVAADQKLSLLGTFLRRSLEVASGYSEAMAMSSPPGVEIGLVAFSMTTLLALFAASSRKRGTRWMRVLAVAAILFVNFKAGFVREDGHVLITTATLFVMSALCAPRFWAQSPLHRLATTAVCVASTACFSFALLHYSFGGLLYVVEEMCQRLPVATSFLTRPLMANAQLRQSYEAGLATIRKRIPLAGIDGTVDVYPWHQSIPIAYGLNYTPRPVFESYSAYSPLLARLNTDHLLGSKAPQTILFDIGTIDDRYPSLDDGPSWPILLSRYEVAEAGPDFLKMTRRSSPLRVERASIALRKANLGEELSIPTGAGAVWCEIDVRPSLAGRLITILLRQRPLILRVTTTGAAAHDYRLIPSMARAGFLLSPMVENRPSFAALSRGFLFSRSMVTAIKILPAVPSDSHWFQSTYQIRLTALRVDQGADPAPAGTEASRISRELLP